MGTYLGPLVLAALCLSAPALADSKCKAGCSHHGASGNIFAYVEGNTYTYSVEGTTTTSLTGTKGDGTKLSVKATVELSIQPNCAQFIKLRGVSVTGPDGKKYDDLKEIEKHPLRFNFHDGHIDAEVCSVEDDSQTALNVKRALLSLFQVAASQSFGSNAVTEIDVFGSCPTEFSFSKDGDVLIVRKERNLNRCAYREDFRSDILSVGYAGASPLQNTPLMASSLKSTQRIKNKIIDSAESVEEYFYRPLSNRDAGAKTVVETKIKLVSTKKQAPSSTAVTRQRSIIFDVPHVTTVPGNADAITKAMHKAHENMKTVVGESSARDFGDVVQVLRQSTKDDILKAFKESHHKSMFIEALIRTGTGDAVQAGVELIKQKEIKGATEKIWYMSLGFVRHATPGSLAAVASLIDGSSSRSLVLGAGALAGRYCREHDCDNKSEFNTLISKLAGPLGSSCKPKDKADENKIIASLKAIHNIHNLNDATAKIVSQCASDVSLPARIRVVALEAFHGDACIPKLRETALNILKNIEEDSEIRIKAYLALVDCPNGQVANALKEIIEKEPSYQVGAFIVSHLRNLRASANPDKESAKAQLGNLKPTKRFPNDLRKFSRNFEVSTLVDLLNIGASAESNVIFSQKSYVPRSASLNLTTDVFGHSVNLFELGLRAENIDRVLEHIFGPKGYVRSNNVREMFDESKDRLVGLAEKISARFAKSTRGKRSVSRDQINALSKKVSLGPKDFDAEVDIDFSVKIFGLESIWLNYQGGHVSPDSIVDKIFDGIDAGIDKAKKFNYDIQKHLQFLDTDLTYPTGLGVPLKLSATGNAVIHLKLDGKLDLHSILKDPLNAEAKLSIVPSAAVEVNGLMVVDAIVVQTGLKLSTTLHTATGSDVTVKILNGNGIDVNFGLPIPKQDLITLKSEIFNYKREEGQSEVNTPLTFNTKRKDYHGCFDQLNSFIGVTFCAEGGLPIETPTFNAAFFPLSGPAKLSVRAEKDDSGMTGYHLRALYDKKSPQKCSFEVSVDTPGSKTNRKVALILEGSTSPEYAVKAALTSPWKKLALEGQILDNDKKQMLVGKFINDKAEYSVNLGLDVTGTPDARTYAPVLEYVAPGGRKEALTGKDGKKQSVSIEGTITIEKKGDTWRKYKFNGIAVNTPVGKYGVDGSITKDSNLVAHDLKLSMDKTSANVKTDLQRLGPNAYKAHIEVVPNQSPDFSFAIDWDYKRENNQVDNKLIVAHGANLKATESRVTLIQQGNLKGDSLSNFDVSTKQKLTYPPLGIDGKLDAAATKKSANYDFFFKYDNKKVESKLSAKINQKAVGDYEVKFSAKVNDKGISIESMRSKPAADKAKGHHVLELTPGGKYEINSDVTYNFEKNNINYLGEHLIKLHQQPDIKISTAFVNNPNNFNTHCFVTYGDTKYLDSSAKLDRNAGSPSGSYKIIIKDYFDSHGELKYAGGKGSGSFVVDIPKVQRKIKGSAELSSSGSKHKLSADLLWNADKDPKQKIHFETDSDLAPKAINSKNTIVIMDWKTLVNIKHEMTGTNRDGTVKKELDVTIPNGRRFLMRCDHGLHLKPDQPGSGDLLVLLEDHNGSAVRSSELKVSAKGVDVKHGAFDGAVDFTYKSPSGKDVEAKLNAKNTYAGDKKWVAEGKGSIKSALLSKPVNLEFNSEVTPNLVSYKLKGQNVLSLEYDIQGKVVTGLEKDKHSRHADTSIDLKLPSDHIKNIKIKTDWTMTAEEGSPCQVGFKHLWDMLEKIKNQKGLKLASTLSMLVPNLVPSCEVKALNEISWDEKTTKLNGALKADLRRGSTKVILTLPNDKPRSVQTSWVHELDQDPPKLSSTVNAQWDEKKEVKLDFKVEGLKDLSDIHAKLSGTTNVNQKHDFTIDVANKRKSERATKTDVSLSLDDKKVKVGVDLDMAEKSPKFDINVEHPGGKLRVASKTERKSDKEIKNEGEIQWPYQGGGKLAWEVEAKAESVDNFDIKGKIDSEKLKLNKYEIAVASKPGDKKQITFTCKSADQNILSGSTNYQFKEEGKLWTMEGSGNVQIKNEARSTHFKYTRQQLDLSQDHEIGFEHKLDVDLGGKESIQLVRKLSNTQHRFINVYCDKEKKCARIEYDHNIKKQDFVDVDRELKIVFDLKSLGVPHDFNFQHNRVRHGRIIDIDSVLNMDSGAEKTTISSKVYAHDKSAGVIITLPKRTIEALAELEIPNGKQEGSFKAALSLWLDKKRQPNLKSAVIILGNVAQSQQDGASLTGEARFVHPGAKELSATTKVIVGGPKNLLNAQADLDVFADQNQKVVLEAKVAALEIPSGRNITVNVGAKSKGLSLDVELLGHVALSPEVISASQFLVYQDQDEKKGSRNVGAYAMLSKEKLILVATIPGSVLLKVKSDLKITRDLQSIDSTIDLFGMKPVVVQGEVKDLNSAIFSVFKKDDPKKKLSLKGGFGWGQVAEVRATKQDGDAKNDLFYVTVALDESHFLQTEYGGSYDNVKATIDGLRKEGSAFANQARIQIADAVLEGNKNVRDIADKIKQARPNIKPVTETYQKELKTLADELANEKLAKEITDIIKEAVARITAILEKIQAEFQKYAEILEKPLKQLFDTVKQWVVKLNEVYGSVAEAAVGACDAVAQLLANYMSKIVELVRKHEEEIKRIATVVGQGIQDVGRIVSKAVGQIRHDVEDFVKLFMEQLKALPIYEVLKERYQELKKYQIPDQAWSMIRDLIDALSASMPTPEVGDLFQAISGYAEKHLKHEKVDDVAELKAILNSAIAALKSLVNLVKNQISQSDLDKLVKFAAVPLPGSSWFQLPIFAPIHLSPLKWLQSGDLPSLSEAYYTYRPTLNPLDWVPPYKMYGILVDSHNFYTFDRKYYNFNGACSYVLAQDFVDGNFSLVVNLEGGKFKSILLNDAKDSIELESDMSILVNGKPQDFPVNQGDLSAWRRYDSANLRSASGVFVTCDLKRQVCQFFLSGFYFGKTRGLLGNMNYEEFDDLALPNGKIASKIADFGNAWKVNSECSDVPNVEHDHAKESYGECNRFFSGSSPLSSCFPYINPAAFRTACEHVATEAKSEDAKKKAACNLAFAYTQSCRYEHVKVDIPASCASCTAGSSSSPIALGDTVSVKAPQTMADIILVVEQIKPNEEVFKDLVVPLIASLSNELKGKGITDVHFSLLGFGAPEQKWPSHYTSGGELSFEGKTKNIWFGAPTTYEKPLDTVEKKIKWIKHQIDLETGNLKLVDAFTEAGEFPYRAGAVKSIIGVMGQGCEGSLLPLSLMQVRTHLASYRYRDQGISLHVISPLSDLALDNDKPSADIVGFDSDNVYTIGDDKKKPFDGNKELRDHLKNESDTCIKVALGTYGSAFSSKNFLAAKPPQRKQFVSVISKRVTDSLTGGEIVQDCKCSLQDGLHPKVNCKVISRTDKRHG